jgi:hypothetical protein
MFQADGPLRIRGVGRWRRAIDTSYDGERKEAQVPDGGESVCMYGNRVRNDVLILAKKYSNLSLRHLYQLVNLQSPISVMDWMDG